MEIKMGDEKVTFKCDCGKIENHTVLVIEGEPTENVPFICAKCIKKRGCRCGECVQFQQLQECCQS